MSRAKQSWASVCLCLFQRLVAVPNIAPPVPTIPHITDMLVINVMRWPVLISAILTPPLTFMNEDSSAPSPSPALYRLPVGKGYLHTLNIHTPNPVLLKKGKKQVHSMICVCLFMPSTFNISQEWNLQGYKTHTRRQTEAHKSWVLFLNTTKTRLLYARQKCISLMCLINSWHEPTFSDTSSC